MHHFIGVQFNAAGMISRARMSGLRILAALLIGALLVGSALSVAQTPPLRESARLVKSEGDGSSSLKKALAALASLVSGIALSAEAGEETPVSP